jgi:hypothetical protein
MLNLPGRKHVMALENAVAEWRQNRVLWIICVVLLIPGANWMRLGFKGVVAGYPPGHGDFHARWMEQRYVENRQNPYDIVLREAAIYHQRPIPECSRDDRTDPSIGPLQHWQCGYPPWAYFSAAAFVLPIRYEYARNYFAVLNALALGISLAWAYQVGRPHSRAGGVFLATAVLAMYANFVCLDLGQYGILINALLIGVYILVERHRPVLAGITFGVAAIKPQITALFAIVFLVRRQWTLLAAATAYVLLACGGTWYLTKTNPIEMLGQMRVVVGAYIGRGTSSIPQLLLNLGMEQQVAAPLTIVLGLVSTLVIMWLWRNSPTLTLFAVAATIGRIWTYHQTPDNVMLIFLVVALGKLVLDHRSIWTVIAFFAVACSLTIRFQFHTIAYPLWAAFAQMSSWLFGMAVLLTAQSRFSRHEAAEDLREREAIGRWAKPRAQGLSIKPSR